MTRYAKKIAGVWEFSQPGTIEPKLLDGRPIAPRSGKWSPKLAALCGFTVVDESPERPLDTPTITYNEALVDSGGVPTRTWVPRDLTVEELAARAAIRVAELDEQIIETERQGLKTNDIPSLIDERDTAQLERSRMGPDDPANLDFQVKWRAVNEDPFISLDGSGSNAARLTALETAVNDLGLRVDNQAKLVNAFIGQFRKLFGSIRFLSLVILRKLRIDRS